MGGGGAALTVTSVAGGVELLPMFTVCGRGGHLGIKRFLEQQRGELLEQAVLTNKVL